MIDITQKDLDGLFHDLDSSSEKPSEEPSSEETDSELPPIMDKLGPALKDETPDEFANLFNDLDEPAPKGPEPAPTTPPPDDDNDAERAAALAEFEEAQEGFKTEQRYEEDLTKPWMRFHKFVLVKAIEEVKELVDQAIAHGRCALDLETEGFDNRIDYIDGKPRTRHKVVGYCLSVKAVGYYIPVRHKYNAPLGEKNPNLPIKEVEAEITRLCKASQPILTAEGMAKDPLGSSLIQTPPRVCIYFWNAKFDQEYLFPITGIDFWHPASFEDGMLACYALYTDDKSLGLKDKAGQRLTLKDGEGKVYPYEMIKIDELFPKGLKKAERHFQDLYPEDGNPVTLYGCSDAICTELLCESEEVDWDYAEKPAGMEYDPPVAKMGEKLYASTYRLEKQVSQAVRIMERSRSKINLDEIDRLLRLADEELQNIDERILAQAKAKGFKNFNPASPPQLAEFLFSKRGLDLKPKPDKTATGQYKTDADTLEKLANKTGLDILKLFVLRRQVEKSKGTYLLNMRKNCDEQQQLRFNFKQVGAVTGRFSAPKGRPDHGFSGIPIQGIPQKHDPEKPEVTNSLRRIFVAREGYVLAKVDYAGQELRILANLSKEPLWTHEFLNGDGDLHSLTAKAFFPGIPRNAPDFGEYRKKAKVANFALAYGGGVQAIMAATKCDKIEAARKKAAFDKSVPVFAKWLKKQHAIVKKHLGVISAFGRFIKVPDAMIEVGDLIGGKVIESEGEVRKIRAGCERKSVNYPIQSSGADICKIALVKCAKEFHRLGWLKNGGDDSVRLLMTVHDEIVFEIRKDRLQEALDGVITPCMESPADIAGWRIPLIVEPLVGPHWGSKHDWLLMMKGEEEIPDFLREYVKPGAPPPTPTPAAAPASPASPTAAPASAPAEPTHAAPTAAPETNVATFALPYSNCLPRSTQKLVRRAIGGAAPNVDEKEKAKRLRLVDSEGNLLIDPQELDIFVIPDDFGRELQERNLGPGTYDTTYE